MVRSSWGRATGRDTKGGRFLVTLAPFPPWLCENSSLAVGCNFAEACKCAPLSGEVCTPSSLNPRPETRNSKPETRNSKPETRNSKPETRDPKPETRDPKPETETPKPCTCSSRACTCIVNSVSASRCPATSLLPDPTLVAGRRFFSPQCQSQPA